MSAWSSYLIKTRLYFTSSFLHQNNPKPKYWSKNESIYTRDFEAVQTPCSHILPGLKTHGDYMNYLINYLTKGSLN